MASASIRREGSTKFGANNKWAWFPCQRRLDDLVRTSWRAKVFDVLKFRAGFGITGSLPTDPYMSRYLRQQVLELGTLTGSWLTAIRSEYQLNPDLKWEKNESLNIGFDFGLLGWTPKWYDRLV